MSDTNPEEPAMPDPAITLAPAMRDLAARARNTPPPPTPPPPTPPTQTRRYDEPLRNMKPTPPTQTPQLTQPSRYQKRLGSAHASPDDKQEAPQDVVQAPPPAIPPEQAIRLSSVRVPTEMLEELTRRQLRVAAQGGRLVVSRWIVDAIDALPRRPKRLASELEAAGPAINLGVRIRDENWRPTQTKALRLTPAADSQLDQMLEGLFGETRHVYTRQNLVCLAIHLRLGTDTTGVVSGR